MHLHLQRQQLKSAMLPIAMITGALFYKWIGYLTFLSPWLIFLMLFITYCRIEPREFKPRLSQLGLLAVQMVLSAVIYVALLPLSHTVSEGVFICVFIPTATAAPVITSMLGGSISFVATYSLLCNILVALIGSPVLALVGDYRSMGFIESTLAIMKRVFPLLIMPIFAALLLRYLWPRAHKAVRQAQALSFYLWVVALLLIVGSCVSFVILHWDDNQIPSLIMMVAGALGVCLLQFYIGRKLGARLMRSKSYRGKDDLRVSCAQSLMQKNTVLAVWLAMAYMTPLASVAPAAYIAWQNIVNSWQLWNKNAAAADKNLNGKQNTTCDHA